MDRKSEWALGEFRDPPIELRLLDNSGAAAEAGKGGGNTSSTGTSQQQPGEVGKDVSTAVGGRRRVLSTRSTYQGERLAGLLVVKFEPGELGTCCAPKSLLGCTRSYQHVYVTKLARHLQTVLVL